jgi:hypothetical protein
MKSIQYEIGYCAILLKKNNQIMFKTSVVLTTLFVCALITFIPQLTPLWSAWATDSSI